MVGVAVFVIPTFLTPSKTGSGSDGDGRRGGRRGVFLFDQHRGVERETEKMKGARADVLEKR